MEGILETGCLNLSRKTKQFQFCLFSRIVKMQGHQNTLLGFCHCTGREFGNRHVITKWLVGTDLWMVLVVRPGTFCFATGRRCNCLWHPAPATSWPAGTPGESLKMAPCTPLVGEGSGGGGPSSQICLFRKYTGAPGLYRNNYRRTCARDPNRYLDSRSLPMDSWREAITDVAQHDVMLHHFFFNFFFNNSRCLIQQRHTENWSITIMLYLFENSIRLFE